MHYTDFTGATVTGELWSPGPLMHTVWVLTAGVPVVVDTRTMTQKYYIAPALGVPHSKSTIEAAEQVIEACPKTGYPRQLKPRTDTEADAVARAQTVIAQRRAFDVDWHNRQLRRSQRAPLSKKTWAEFIGAHIGDFAVDSPDLFVAA